MLGWVLPPLEVGEFPSIQESFLRTLIFWYYCCTFSGQFSTHYFLVSFDLKFITAKVWLRQVFWRSWKLLWGPHKASYNSIRKVWHRWVSFCMTCCTVKKHVVALLCTLSILFIFFWSRVLKQLYKFSCSIFHVNLVF